MNKGPIFLQLDEFLPPPLILLIENYALNYNFNVSEVKSQSGSCKRKHMQKLCATKSGWVFVDENNVLRCTFSAVHLQLHEEDFLDEFAGENHFNSQNDLVALCSTPSDELHINWIDMKTGNQTPITFRRFNNWRRHLCIPQFQEVVTWYETERRTWNVCRWDYKGQMTESGFRAGFFRIFRILIVWDRIFAIVRQFEDISQAYQFDVYDLDTGEKVFENVSMHWPCESMHGPCEYMKSITPSVGNDPQLPRFREVSAVTYIWKEYLKKPEKVWQWMDTLTNQKGFLPAGVKQVFLGTSARFALQYRDYVLFYE